MTPRTDPHAKDRALLREKDQLFEFGDGLVLLYAKFQPEDGSWREPGGAGRRARPSVVRGTDNEPRARAVWFREEKLVVALTDRREIAVPVDWYPGLQQASDQERESWEIVDDGEGIHWPDLDEEISVRRLLQPEDTIG